MISPMTVLIMPDAIILIPAAESADPYREIGDGHCWYVESSEIKIIHDALHVFFPTNSTVWN